MATPALGEPTPASSPSTTPGAAATGSIAPSSSGSASPTGSPSATDDGLPVLGQASVGAFGLAQERFPQMIVTVHGLRRLPKATVLYYSLGFLGTAPDPRVMPVTHYGSGPGTYQVLQASPGEAFTDAVAAIDVPGAKAYAALRTAAGRSVSGPPPVDLADRFRLSDRAVVQWIALAPIPAEVASVDVLIGSAFIQGIPVRDGAMVPTVSDRAPVAGAGWPRIPEAELLSGSADGAVATLTATITPRPSEPSPAPAADASPASQPAGSPAS